MNGVRIEHTLAGAIWPRRGVEADALRARDGSRFLRDAALCAFGVALLTLSSTVSVPFLPVPMTLQTFAVLCLGAAYGVRLSAITVVDQAIT